MQVSNTIQSIGGESLCWVPSIRELLSQCILLDLPCLGFLRLLWQFVRFVALLVLFLIRILAILAVPGFLCLGLILGISWFVCWSRLRALRPVFLGWRGRVQGACRLRRGLRRRRRVEFRLRRDRVVALGLEKAQIGSKRTGVLGMLERS